MVSVSELFEGNALESAVSAGLVRSQTAVVANKELTIYKYTDKCVFERSWDSVTKTCRGLIVDNSGVVYSRPFKKFLNLSELSGEELAKVESQRGVVLDKLDGTCIQMFFMPEDGQWHFATLGSLDNEYIDEAIELYHELYAHAWSPIPGFTYVFELISPVSRIVVNYEGARKLVLLGKVDIASGVEYAPGDVSEWVFERPAEFGMLSTNEVSLLPVRANAEGYVVVFGDGSKVKMKLAEYLRLHKLRFNLSPKHVWRLLAREGLSGDELIASFPEEFRDEVEPIVVGFVRKFERLRVGLEEVWDEARSAGYRDRELYEFCGVRGLSASQTAVVMRLSRGMQIDFSRLWSDIQP